MDIGNPIKDGFTSLNWGLLKKERVCSLESEFFPFRADPFLNGLGAEERKQGVTKVATFIKWHVSTH